MSDLPTDVLLLIFHLLGQSDKLECMTVCRQWHDIIIHHNLFRVICVDRQQQLDQLIEKIKRDPLIGAQVERFIMEFAPEREYDATILGDFFPNLRDFSLENCPKYKRDYEPVNPHKSHPWCEKIKKMVEHDWDRSVQTLLLSGLCENLTYISVAGVENKPVRSFVEALANAPALKTLSLDIYNMTFQDLELLHENTPLLHSLSLSAIRFTDTPGNLIIKPATSLKIFHCAFIEFESYPTLNQHLPYVIQKYTHLEELGLYLDVLWIGDDEDDYDDDVNDYENATVAEQRAIITSYMKTLAPRLRTFSLRVDPFEFDVMNAGFDFNILDGSGCQIEKLTLEGGMDVVVLEWLANTTQVKYIESLDVNSITVKNDDYSPISLEWLLRFTALKELALRFPTFYSPKRKYTLTLGDLLVNLKETQLKSLTLYYVRLEIHQYEKTVVYPSLKELSLHFVSLEIGADMRLAQTFPNLKRLKLINCFEEGGTLTLPNIDLTYLEIKKPRFPIMVVTLGDGQHRLYNTNTPRNRFPSDEKKEIQNTTNSPYIFPRQPFYKSKNAPKLIILCNSVHSFKMTK